MSIDVRINGEIIGQVDVANRTGNAVTDEVNRYRWHFVGDGHRVLDDEIMHRYGDGAMVLAAKVLAEIAKRYEIAAAVKAAAE